MFTPEGRDQARSGLLEYAARDRRISGAAITGSAAGNGGDRWSDIDLAFGVVDEAEMPNVLSDWTAHMYDRHGAPHHVDVKSGAWIYRVFLLSSTLQVDLAFVSGTEFRALAPTFRLISGKANEPMHAPLPGPLDIIGLGWLYALHALSSIARQRFWHSAADGHGIDELPSQVKGKLESSLIWRLDVPELLRAFRVVTEGLLSEIKSVDAELAVALQEVLRHLTENSF